MISTVSPFLYINVDQTNLEVRAALGYEAVLSPLSISFRPEGPTTEDSFNLSVIVEQEVNQYGQFWCAGSTPSYSIKFDPVNNATTQQMTSSGQTQELQKLLGCLVFKRVVQTKEDVSFQVKYEIRSFNSTRTAVDITKQSLVFSPRLSFTTIPKVNTMYVDPEQRFIYDLVKINESVMVQDGQEPLLDDSSSTLSFYSISVKDGIAMLEGIAPAQFGTQQSPQPMARISFSLHDHMTNYNSETFTFFLQIDPKKVQAVEKLKLVLVTAVISTFIVVLFVCAYLMLKREKKQQKEQVKQVIQEELPPDNILTKSILEWNKGGEVGTTRDQTGKDSVHFNPYDKYSLKRAARSKNNYASLKVADGDKDQSHESHYSRGIKSSTGSEVPSGSMENLSGMALTGADNHLRLNTLDKTKDGVFVEKKKSAQSQPFNFSSAKLHSSNEPQAPGSDELLSKMIKEKPSLQDRSEKTNIPFSERDFKNISQLEFSKVEDFNSNLDKKPKEMEFGDLSKILDNKTMLEDGAEDQKRPDKENLMLEDIILKDI